MNYNEYFQLCLDAALDIKEGNFDKDYGICSNLRNKVYGKGLDTEELWLILEQAFYTWPKFSGDINYPINDPYNEVSAHRVYIQSHKWTGEYGALRFELLDHVIDCLKKEALYVLQ